MRILIVEDDPEICEAMQFALEREKHMVDICHHGDEGLQWMLRGAHDLVIMDRLLPGMDGASIVREARRKEVITPVLMITALGEESDKIEGLDCGADDYLAKPISINEMLARVRALGRRPKSWDNSPVVAWGGMELDTVKRELRLGSECAQLTKRETAMLEFFLKNVGVVFSRDTLFQYIWGAASEVDMSNLDNYIRYVRKRLLEVNSPLELVTIRNTGYCLQESSL